MQGNSELRKFVAPEFIFGAGARALAGKYVRNLGVTRVLLVSDSGVTAAGWTEQVRQNIASELPGMTCTLFTDVSPNPRDHQVMDGVRLYRREQCNGIVAIGGGSVIDCAKGIALVVNNGGDILDYEGVDMITHPIAPLVAIPTTAGSAADVSQFAVIRDMTELNKISIISKAIIPDAALIDPETAVTLDPFLTACTGMDAVSHALEALCSNAASPITDVHAEYALRLLAANLPAAVASPDNLEIRTNMMLGCLEAGLAFSNASLGAVHALSHSLGGSFDLAHGECNAILLPAVVAFNYAAVPARYDRAAEALGWNFRDRTTDRRGQALADALDQLRRKLGITHTLGDLGVKPSDVKMLAEKAVGDLCLLTNPRRVETGDLEALYGQAL